MALIPAVEQERLRLELMTRDRLVIPEHRLQAAAAYSATHGGLALRIQMKGVTVFTSHPPHGPSEQAAPLASGTKSFCGILAAAAAADGFLGLDDPVADTLDEWRSDVRKSRITIRQLLQLVSGLEAGGRPGRAPSFHTAVHVAAVADPGDRFFYGAAPFQVFGELMRRKLDAICPDPLDYLQGRVLDRIELDVSRWRRTPEGWPDFSGGAALTASAWARLGELVRQDGIWEDREVLPGRLLRECFVASAANPVYGLGWWLNAPLPPESRHHLHQSTLGLEDLATEPVVPRDLVYAAGAGKQRLYVSRELNLVIVRQAGGVFEALASGERSPFSDREFFRMLLGTSHMGPGIGVTLHPNVPRP
jgi:CubicO group peptidase (beta-lactamase class C family)